MRSRLIVVLVVVASLPLVPIATRGIRGSRAASLLAAQPVEQRRTTPPRVNILDYIPQAEHPAIADHTSRFDCRASIEAAMAESGELYFPAGTYRTSPLTVNRWASHWKGASMGLRGAPDESYTSRIRALGPQPYVVLFANCNFSTFEDLAFDGDNAATDVVAMEPNCHLNVFRRCSFEAAVPMADGKGGALVRCGGEVNSQVDYILFEGCVIQQSYDPAEPFAKYGIHVRNSNTLWIMVSRCRIVHNDIHVYNDGGGTHLTENDFGTYSGYAHFLDGAAHTTMRRCYTESRLGRGFFAAGGLTNRPEAKPITLRENWVHTTGEPATVTVYPQVPFIVEGCFFGEGLVVAAPPAGSNVCPPRITDNIFYRDTTVTGETRHAWAERNYNNSDGNQAAIPNFRPLDAAPAGPDAPGVTGEVRYTADHIYVCVEPNTWRRASLSAW